MTAQCWIKLPVLRISEIISYLRSSILHYNLSITTATHLHSKQSEVKKLMATETDLPSHPKSGSSRSGLRNISRAVWGSLRWLPMGLSLLLQGASPPRPWARRFSRCCSRCRPRTGSSRAPLGPGRAPRAGQSLPCGGKHCSCSPRSHSQQSEGRLLSSSH